MQSILLLRKSLFQILKCGNLNDKEICPYNIPLKKLHNPQELGHLSSKKNAHNILFFKKMEA